MDDDGVVKVFSLSSLLILYVSQVVAGSNPGFICRISLLSPTQITLQNNVATVSCHAAAISILSQGCLGAASTEVDAAYQMLIF